uniref:Heat shock protein 70 n=1 Tax=Panagrolaimus sp. ES5 TaxID=591445 RepID=A0AC34FAT9_9BILA
MGSEYKSEFRKKFLEAAEKENKIKRIKIIGIHETKICKAVQSLDIYPRQGRQLWIFDIREELFYCMIWEFSGEAWKFKMTWQKVKTIKGTDSAPTIHDLRELKSKIPEERMPDIFVYHKYSKVDETEFKEIKEDGVVVERIHLEKHDSTVLNMPSYVFFEEQKPICGHVAVARMKNKADFIVYDAKRFIGKSFDKIVIDPLWPFKIFKNDENVLVEVETFYGRERKSPEEISAVLLSCIKKEADGFESTTLSEVVIGIPSEFSEKQKQATLTAAELAGWQKIHFIPESIAAAFAYCSEIDLQNNSNIVICDFGGGTLDICVARFKDEQLQILSSDGDSFLGGRDLDNVLYTYFSGIIKNKSGKDILLQHKKFLLKEKCQEIKHTLSAANEACLNLDDFIFESPETITMTRKEFENLTSHFLVRIQDVILRALTKANILKNDVKYVFQVGGGCRMPMVKNLLKEIFPQSNHQSNIEPDLAVAHGAALYAYYLKSSTQPKPMEKIRPTSIFNTFKRKK